MDRMIKHPGIESLMLKARVPLWAWFCLMTSNRECSKRRASNSINKDAVSCKRIFGSPGNAQSPNKAKQVYSKSRVEKRRRKNDEHGSGPTKSSIPSECAALFRFASNGDYGFRVAKLPNCAEPGCGARNRRALAKHICHYRRRLADHCGRQYHRLDHALRTNPR